MLILHTDQWRAQRLGYMGNPDVIIPNIDRLAMDFFHIRSKNIT